MKKIDIDTALFVMLIGGLLFIFFAWYSDIFQPKKGERYYSEYESAFENGGNTIEIDSVSNGFVLYHKVPNDSMYTEFKESKRLRSFYIEFEKIY